MGILDFLFGKLSISPQDAYELIAGGCTVLDVRNESDFVASGHIKGARNIPLAELGNRLSEVPRKRKVVVVCQMGDRSASACTKLLRAGIDAVSIEGGMRAWTEVGFPLVFRSPETRDRVNE